MSVPKTYQEALANLGWKKTMEEEMGALVSYGTWGLKVRKLLDSKGLLPSIIFLKVLLKGLKQG